MEDHKVTVGHIFSREQCWYQAHCTCGIKSPRVDSGRMAWKWKRYHLSHLKEELTCGPR